MEDYLFHTPDVSTAIGMMMWNLQRMTYLSVFDVKALLATAPAFEVSLTCEVTKISGVTSHVRHVPLDHGITVTPSGLFPSVLQRPKGFFLA